MWDADNYDDRAIGPMGLHDAYLLDALCRYICPRVALEYGGLLGHSLRVMAPYCEALVSVDDNCGSALVAAAKDTRNARAVKCDMRTYDPVADGYQRLDLILFDASHLFDDNLAAYSKCVPLLQPRTVILVHDTGEWYTGELPPQWEAWKEHRDEFLQEDRKFVRYLRTEGWNDVTFENPNALRHGYTMLTKPRW